jgi:hypothetical protein
MFNLFNCVPQLIIFEYTRVGFIVGYFIALESLVIERFFAIYQLESYEKTNHSSYIIVSVVCQVFGVIIGTVILYFG